MNEQMETSPQPASAPIEANDMTGAPRGAVRLQNMVAPQSVGGNCTCGAAPSAALGGAPSFVYAIGRVEARFPNLAAEKEFAQATGRSDTAGMTDQQTSMPFCPGASTVTCDAKCAGCSPSRGSKPIC
jgi:hypothetical protein